MIYLISEYNVAEWINGYRRVLFIVGLAGSGKTTISERYTIYIPEATIIHTDDVDKTFGNGRENLSTNVYCNELIDHIIDSNSGPLIIEGVHSLAYNVEKMKNQSVIILNTSISKSTIRAFMRDRERYGVGHIKELIIDNIDYSRRITKLKRYLELK